MIHANPGAPKMSWTEYQGPARPRRNQASSAAHNEVAFARAENEERREEFDVALIL